MPGLPISVLGGFEMVRLSSPFGPLDAASSALNAPPPNLGPLASRMADLYGVAPDQLVVTRGALHGFEILIRRSRLNGFEHVMARPDPDLEARLELYGMERLSLPRDPVPRKGVGLCVLENPEAPSGRALSRQDVAALCVNLFPCLVVVDERLCDPCPEASMVGLCAETPNLVIVRDLGFLYGIEGAQVGALIGQARIIAGLGRYVEPDPLPTPSLRAAESALSPSRILSLEGRLARIHAQKAALRPVLAASGRLEGFEMNAGPTLFLRPRSLSETETLLRRAGIRFDIRDKGLWLALGDGTLEARLIHILGDEALGKSLRRAEIIRDTKETRIVVGIDLDAPGPRRIETGNGFFDHMLDQVATHGGFALSVACEGDYHIDPHHAIEDVMLAFGAALKQALGDRIGMARFGFVLPMDETEAQVSVDLGGRPFCVFDGSFSGSHIGDFPTEMCSHAFRSLSETLGAAIHIHVSGANDHHKVEACFKALGRALRQAIRIEGEALPSSKGMLA